MPDSTTIQFTGETADLERKMTRLEKTNARFTKRLRDMAKAGKAAGNAMTKSYRGQKQHLDVLNRAISKQETLVKRSGKASESQTKRLRKWRMEAAALGRQLGRTGRQSRDMGRDSSRMTQGITRGVGNIVAQWASVAGGIRIATLLQQKHWEMIDRRAAATRTFEESFTEVLTLGDNAKNAGKIRKQLFSTAKKYGVDPVEVANMRYSLQSNAAAVDPGRIPEMVSSATAMKGVVSSLSGEDLGNMYGKAASMYPGKSTEEISNIVMYSVERAGVKKAAELGRVAPKAMAAGKIGKDSLRDSMALLSTFTRFASTANRAGTGVEMLIRGVMMEEGDTSETLRRIAGGLKVDPEKRKAALSKQQLAEEAGILPADTGIQRLDKYRARHVKKNYTASQFRTIWNARALKFVMPLMEKYDEFKEEQRLFAKETVQGANIVGVKRAQINEDPMQRTLIATKRTEVGTIIAQQDRKALHEKLRQATAKEINAGSNAPAIIKWVRSAAMDLNTAVEGMTDIKLYPGGFDAIVDKSVARRQQLEADERASVLSQSKKSADGDPFYTGQYIDERMNNELRSRYGVDPALSGGRGDEKVDAIVEALGSSSIVNPNTHVEPVAGGAR